MKIHQLFIILFILMLCGCDSNVFPSASNKMLLPIQVGLYSEKGHNSFIVAPGDEFELNLIGRLNLGNKSIPGQVKFTFEKIGEGIEVDNYKENETIMLEIIPHEEEKLFETLMVKALKKGYYVIDGSAELVNTADYRKPAELKRNYSNILGDSGVYVCVVSSIDEIREFCNPNRNIYYFNPGTPAHNQVEYIGSIRKPFINSNNIFKAEQHD